MHKRRLHTRNGKRIHHLKILNKTEREENSGNETKEEWKRQSVHKQYLKHCTPPNLRGTELGPLLSCRRSLPNEELLVYWTAPMTHKSNELIDDKTFPHCTLHGLINTMEFAINMTFSTAISYRRLLCKEPHNTAHMPISGCYMHHASKRL